MNKGEHLANFRAKKAALIIAGKVRDGQKAPYETNAGKNPTSLTSHEYVEIFANKVLLALGNYGLSGILYYDAERTAEVSVHINPELAPWPIYDDEPMVIFNDSKTIQDC
jgi:hypothetical protein